MGRVFAHSNSTYWVCHLAFWFPLVFATPLFVALNNIEVVQVGAIVVVASLAAATMLGVLVSYLLSSCLPNPWHRRLSVFLLALAIVFTIQGNVVHEFFDYGEFNGEVVNWRSYGWAFWLELWLFLLAIPFLYGLLLRSDRPPRLIPFILIASSILLWLPTLASFAEGPLELSNNQEFDSGVFEFSSNLNLVHLLPDGFQGDIVREVLEQQPEIAAEFVGFTLSTNHVGQFQGTAPSLPTILNGKRFDLSAGHSFKRLMREINEESYLRHLADGGFRLDFVTPSKVYCLEGAASCVVRPFSHGYFEYHGIEYSLRLITDLTLFRHLPMYLKERVYSDGSWLFADTVLDEASRFPDPVIREWAAHMSISDETPRYKWYHFNGTHAPAQWTADCEFVEGLERSRENYKGQTLCVLRGIGRFLRRLKELNVYDQTAIVISGDHGCNVPADDLTGEVVYTTFLRPSFFGHARPAFLFKQRDNREPLEYSDRPTTMIDLAPTALDLVGLSGEFEGVSALRGDPDPERKRTFHRYVSEEYWSGKPVPYAEFEIDGEARDFSSWQLVGIRNVGPAPTRYERMSYADAGVFTRGLGLNPNNADQGHARVYGKEFAFLITPPQEGFEKLRLELRIPESIDRQTISISVNGRPLVQAYAFDSQGGKWIQLAFSIPEAFSEDNNFVRVVFGETVQHSTSPWSVSATIRSIELL